MRTTLSIIKADVGSIGGHVAPGEAAEKEMEMRRQGFSGPAMLPYSELEYGGIVKILERLEPHFTVRPPVRTREPVAVWRGRRTS